MQFDTFRKQETLRTVLKQVYCNSAAVDDELVELIHGPSCDEGALAVFISVLTGDGRRTTVLTGNTDGWYRLVVLPGSTE